MEESIDRIREWENRTGGFVNIPARGSTTSSASGAPF